jgi:hypothetical protein
MGERVRRSDRENVIQETVIWRMPKRGVIRLAQILSSSVQNLPNTIRQLLPCLRKRHTLIVIHK